MQSSRREIESFVSSEITVDGKQYINFGGSAYLGLAAKQEIIEAGRAALERNGAGYQFPREFQIATRGHLEVEQEIATFFNSESGTYLAAGYYYGLMAIAALREKFSAIFFDDWAHYSLREAVAASGLPHYSFRHLDVEDLDAKLKKHLLPKGRPLVVTDGLFGTLGEIAPLNSYAHGVSSYEGRMLVDDSHGFGVLGRSGRGTAEHHDIHPSLAVIGGSTCKALGAVGGIIAATEEEADSFRATPVGRGASVGLPAAAAMCARSLRYIREHPELLRRLRGNTAYMKDGLRKIGLDVGDSVAPVATFVISGHESMATLQQRLMSDGIHVFHTTYMGAGAAGVIRCGIFADHTIEHMDALFDSLRRFL